MTRGPLIRRLCIVTALAGGVVCALEGLPDAGLGADDREAAAQAAAEAAPAPPGSPDGGLGILARRRARRWKRLGVPAPGAPDGGLPAPRDGGHDAVAVLRGAPMTAPVTAPPAPATPPVAGTPPAPPVTDLGFNTCQKIPRGKRVVKMNLKPDIELTELIAWISSITCQSFVLPGHLSAGGKKVTIVSQGPMTRDEAFAAFLTALDTLGLTVERGPGYMRIIETAKAKTSSTPVYGFDGQPTTAK